MAKKLAKPKLNPMQRAFARNYGRDGGTATDAAKRAGYSDKTAGKQAWMLHNLADFVLQRKR